MSQSDNSDQRITVSIVSHGHGPQVALLVRQVLADHLVDRLVLTLNIKESLDLPDDPRLLLIENPEPKGFGANHNQAFAHCDTTYYCVLNPDVILHENALERLLRCVSAPEVGVAGPLVLSSSGHQEDSWRAFPTWKNLLSKALGKDTSIILLASDLTEPIPLDWVAGMSMLFRSDVYKLVQGFDERFFMYYEDVDICARIGRSVWRVVGCPNAVVTHDAQRASRKNLTHLRWHISSMLRFLLSNRGAKHQSR